MLAGTSESLAVAVKLSCVFFVYGLVADGAEHWSCIDVVDRICDRLGVVQVRRSVVSDADGHRVIARTLRFGGRPVEHTCAR